MNAKKCKMIRKIMLEGKDKKQLKDFISHEIPYKASVPDEKEKGKFVIKEFIFKTIETNPIRRKYRAFKKFLSKIHSSNNSRLKEIKK